MLKTDYGLLLCQNKYIKDLLGKATMQFARSSNTPMISGLKLIAYGNDCVTDAQMYKSIVGGL